MAGRARKARRAGVGREWQARLGLARKGMAWHGRQGRACRGKAGRRRHGRRGEARCGAVRFGGAGNAGLDRHGWVRTGPAREDAAGVARPGESRKAWRETAGMARHDRARQAAARNRRQSTGYEHMNTYEFASGRHLPKGADPTAIGLEIETIISERGAARPEYLVERASDPASPLHSCFEWDDSAAARAHRLEQARYVLRSVVIVREDRPEQTIRAFVSPAREGDWKTIDAALSSPTDRELLLAQARADLEAFVRKYQALEELNDVRAAAQQFVSALGPAKAKPRRKVENKEAVAA